MNITVPATHILALCLAQFPPAAAMAGCKLIRTIIRVVAGIPDGGKFALFINHSAAVPSA